jgi:hypothetical protein
MHDYFNPVITMLRDARAAAAVVAQFLNELRPILKVRNGS